MTSATGPSDSLCLGLRVNSWLRLCILASLMALLFWPNLRRLWDKTNPISGDEEWQHALAVPLIGLYYLYMNRDSLRAAQVETAWSGLPILIGGIALFGYAIFPLQNDFMKDLGMVATLFGLVTLLAGWQVMRVAWFPIVFLICALPWPGLFYQKVATPLQHLAASGAVFILRLAGVDAQNSGTRLVIHDPERTLNVAEACAGLKALMAFVTVGASVAFLSSRALWQKILLVLSAVPIAIFCNTVRVAGQALLDHYVSQGWSESFAHKFAGFVILMPAFFLILLIGWILDHAFIEEAETKAYKIDAGRESVKRHHRTVPPPLAMTARRPLRQSSFVVATFVLAVSALTLNAGVEWFQLQFKKQPVALRVKSFSDAAEGIPAQLGDWVQVSQDQPLDPDMEANLRSRQYIFRDYVNSRLVKVSDIAAIRNDSPAHQHEDLAKLRQYAPPEAFLRIAITYTTGLVDTVAHIPERCYVADGFEPSSWEIKQAICGAFPDGKPRNIEFRFIRFEDQSGRNRVACRVGYLFNVNGRYESDPYAVRRRLQNLLERYGYYAKVELMTVAEASDFGTDSHQAEATLAAMKDFLTCALPELERCLPDWQKLHAGT